MAKTKKMNSQRLYYLDILRFVGALGVIGIHASCKEIYTDFLSYNWYVSSIFDSLVRWAVPIFVMISGALFLQPTKEISLKNLITKNISRLLIVYLFWWLSYAILSSAWIFIFDKTFIFSLKEPYYHLWFLPMLMGVYLFIPILRKISTDEKLIFYYLIVWYIYISGSFFFIFIDAPQIKELFNINSIIGYLGYFLLGYYISIHSISKKQQRIIYALGLLGLFITILGYICLSIYSGASATCFFKELSPHVILTTSALFVFIKEKSTNLSHKSLYFINHVRKDLFGIYLIHPAYLLICNIFRNTCNHIITIPLSIIIAFIFSLYTSKLLRKTPLKKFVE